MEATSLPPFPQTSVAQNISGMVNLTTSSVVLPFWIVPSQHVCGIFSGDFSISGAILCAVFLLVGFFLCLYGYRLLTPGLYLASSCLILPLIWIPLLIFSVTSQLYILLISCFSSLIISTIICCIPIIGAVFSGSGLGVSVTIWFLCCVELVLHLRVIWLSLAFVLVGFLFTSILTLRYSRTFIILGCSSVGSALIIVSIDYFLQQNLLLMYVLARVLGLPPSVTLTQVDVAMHGGLCWYGWVLLGMWPVVLILSALLQFFVISKRVYHDSKSLSVGCHCNSMKKVEYRESPGNLSRRFRLSGDGKNSTRYTCIYQARRCNGDVISASQLASMQRKALPPHEYRQPPDIRSIAQLSAGMHTPDTGTGASMASTFFERQSRGNTFDRPEAVFAGSTTLSVAALLPENELLDVDTSLPSRRLILERSKHP